MGANEGFELHLGFPVQAEAAAQQTLALLQETRTGWSYSDVTEVETDPSIIDPHNVPGTLRYLVSRDYPTKHLSDSDLVNLQAEIITEAQFVLKHLSEQAINDVRLEVEYAFGKLSMVDKDTTREKLCIDMVKPLALPYNKIVSQYGQLVKDTPKWEIHFVLERLPNRKEFPSLSITHAVVILQSYSVNVAQTIRYLSYRHILSGSEETKIICTSYYPTALAMESEARRLFLNTSLIEEFSSNGYSVTLILERILACLQPSLVNQSAGQYHSNISENGAYSTNCL